MSEIEEKSDFSMDAFELIPPQPVELDVLDTELSICFQDIDGPCEIKTCYGDVKNIVDTLMYQAKLLDKARERWELPVCQDAKYEFLANKLRAIAHKYQAGIGYDYEAALEMCRKKTGKRQAESSDTGGEALEMGYRAAEQRRKAKEKEKKG